MMNDSNLNATISFRYFGFTTGYVAIFVGFANLLTIVAVLGNHQLRKNSFNLFIVNLSVVDLITSLVMLPFHMISYHYMYWPFGMQWCKVQAYFYFSCGYTSIVFLVVITINRFMGVVFPDKYKMFFAGRKLKGIFLFCWVTAPLVLAPVFITSMSMKEHSITGWNKCQFLCTYLEPRGFWLTYMKVLRVVFQFIPTALMVVSYSAIVYYVHANNLRIESQSHSYRSPAKISRAAQQSVRSNLSGGMSESQSSPALYRIRRISQIAMSMKRQNSSLSSNSASPSTRVLVRSRSRSMRQAREQHLVFLSIIVCLTFTLLFLPSLVMNLIPGSATFDPRFHMAASNLAWLNSCVNPCIYALLHKRMRKEYKRILKKLYSSFKSCLHC